MLLMYWTLIQNFKYLTNRRHIIWMRLGDKGQKVRKANKISLLRPKRSILGKENHIFHIVFQAFVSLGKFSCEPEYQFTNGAYRRQSPFGRFPFLRSAAQLVASDIKRGFQRTHCSGLHFFYLLGTNRRKVTMLVQVTSDNVCFDKTPLNNLSIESSWGFFQSLKCFALPNC